MATVAIVTGGASGIGAATALRLARRGHQVVVADLKPDQASKVVAQIEAAGQPAGLAVGCDVTMESDVDAMVAAAEELGHGIDVLVNCAGLAGDAMRFDEAPIALWQQVVDVNLWGTVHSTRAVARVMRRQGSGVIVNVASIAAIQGSRGQVPYSAAKSAVVGLTIAAAKELLASGIRVNAVAPGVIATPMTDAMPEQMRTRWRLDTLTLGGGLGQADQVASCIEFLCSSDASFVTGVVLPVDGGFRLGYP